MFAYLAIISLNGSKSWLDSLVLGQIFIFRYNSDGNPAHNTIEEVEGSENEESLYDNVPKRNSGSKKFRRSRGQTDNM